jgi:hypothetical protein
MNFIKDLGKKKLTEKFMDEVMERVQRRVPSSRPSYEELIKKDREKNEREREILRRHGIEPVQVKELRDSKDLIRINTPSEGNGYSMVSRYREQLFDNILDITVSADGKEAKVNGIKRR